MTTVLLIDDVPAMAEQYAFDLQRLGGYTTIVSSSGLDALEIMDRERVHCIILDLEMPGMDGFDVLREFERRGIVVPVIVYTGTGNFDRCIQAIRLGARSFIDKAEPMPRVVQEIENVIDRQRLEDEVQLLRARAGHDSPLRGSAPALETLREHIARVAPIPSPVLILGESGSGKELVARELHRGSQVADGPFVAINCAALPEALVESELFGHEKGAFTGAARLRTGAFENAAGGTLFLDEIGELPAPAQAKLLRVLEQRELTRVGGDRTLPVTARVVAATNRDLDAEVAAGGFREDLLFRLNVHTLHVPPLRDRASDIPDLVRFFLQDTATRFGASPKGVDPAVLERMSAHPWARNNVRELRNAVERIFIATAGDVIGVDDIPPDIQAGPSVATPGSSFREQKAEAERHIVISALERNVWQIKRTAAELGLADHASLLKIMRRHGIQKPS